MVTLTKDTPFGTIVKVDSDKITVKQKIPFGHKFAIKNIKRGSAIIKYGVKIGVANVEIRKGEHVHIHNVDEVSLEIREEEKKRSLGMF